jgi:predicted O-methyltransferase YrrM
LDRLYEQLAALLQIERLIGPDVILRPLRGWALSPDAIVQVLAELHPRANPVMIEFGSGQSTVIFASYFKRRGGGRLISVEHNAQYAAQVRAQVEALGLAGFVDLRVVELIEIPGSAPTEACKSYNLAGLDGNLVVDVALVDGPPSPFGSLTRLHPASWALDHLAPGGKVFLDDSNRPSEKLVVQEIVKKMSGIKVEKIPAEKGLVALSFAAGHHPLKPFP